MHRWHTACWQQLAAGQQALKPGGQRSEPCHPSTRRRQASRPAAHSTTWEQATQRGATRCKGHSAPHARAVHSRQPSYGSQRHAVLCLSSSITRSLPSSNTKSKCSDMPPKDPRHLRRYSIFRSLVVPSHPLPQALEASDRLAVFLTSSHNPPPTGMHNKRKHAACHSIAPTHRHTISTTTTITYVSALPKPARPHNHPDMHAGQKPSSLLSSSWPEPQPSRSTKSHPRTHYDPRVQPSCCAAPHVVQQQQQQPSPHSHTAAPYRGCAAAVGHWPAAGLRSSNHGGPAAHLQTHIALAGAATQSNPNPLASS